MRWNEVGAVRLAARLTQLRAQYRQPIGDVNGLPGMLLARCRNGR